MISLLMQKGWTKEQAIGIAINLQAESGFSTKAHGDRGLVEGGSHGLAQWNGKRLSTLKNMYGNEWDNLDNQVSYIDWELRNTEKLAGDRLKKASTVEEASSIITKDYERPARKEFKAKERIGMLKDWSDLFSQDYVFKDVPVEESTNNTNIQYNQTQPYKQVSAPSVSYQTNTGELATVPMSKEEKSDISKIEILQKQLQDTIAQLQNTPQNTGNTSVETPQIVQQQPQQESYSYLTDTNLFTVQDANI